MSLLNLAQVYQSTGDNTQAILTLTEGIKKLKNRKAVENTLGLLYAKVGVADSAAKYLSQSNFTSNLVGLAALNRIVLNDSVRQNDTDPVMNVNRLALANSRGQLVSEQLQLPSDTVLTLVQAAAISNYLMNKETIPTRHS